jgi:RNA polymerase sigma factor (sigma-70 family)
MDLKNIQWNQADQDFNLWLNGTTIESSLPHSDILRSIFLAFRQIQIQRLSSFCKQAFEYYIEQERISAEIVRDPIFRDNEIMFRRIELSESEKRARTSEENKKVIDGILSGNQKIFNNLYEYEFPKVVKLIIHNSGSVEAANDVFQDAIVILMEKVYAQKLDLTCSVETYLYSICKYLWLDQLRQNKRERQMIQFFDEEYNSNEISVHFYYTPEIFDNVVTAIDALGDPCKQLLECFYYKNMSWDKIASSLNYANAASARNQKYKCLERIRNVVHHAME